MKSYRGEGLSSGVTTDQAVPNLTNFGAGLLGSPKSTATPGRVYILGTQQAATQPADGGVMTLDPYPESELVDSGQSTLVYRTGSAVLLKLSRTIEQVEISASAEAIRAGRWSDWCRICGGSRGVRELSETRWR